ncbi:hypothetical protein [Tunturiibacter gelidiferens]|uniref:hypothetical protein n=1 Tax=Tunturiibacter gelidiferens TaxID=3069689 RepID=UPI003D9BA19B
MLPLKWDEGYLDRWLKGASGANAKDVEDYAIILRHTYRDEPRKLSFVLAGFTERATAISGIYLAKNWSSIWERYVKDKVDTPSRGDFLMFIAGPSRPGRVDEVDGRSESACDYPGHCASSDPVLVVRAIRPVTASQRRL